ncbi:MAG: restriction endonuclease [Fimbriimonadaceae bacterium]|nr:restriction endonuclease [Fimbriimonadaceae bacterium]
MKILYEGRFTGKRDFVDFTKYGESNGIEGEHIKRTFHRLLQTGLFKSRGCGMFLQLTVDGVLCAEEMEFFPKLTERQDLVRRVILKEGMIAWEEGGHLGVVNWREAMRSHDLSDEDYPPNFFHLLERGVVKGAGPACFQLTQLGAIIATRIKMLETFERRWNDLKALKQCSQQQRGHRLEDLVADLARFDGLTVDTRVRSSGEENDVVISDDLHHFLVSCKWEKGKAKSEYLDILRARIAKRPGTVGLLVSVGGFSSELVREAESNTSLGLVILCGAGDLDQLVSGKQSLKEFICEAHTHLIRSRTVNPRE